MKYKVGDKVKVREDYYGKALIDTMEKFKGKVVTISDITSETKGEYHIEEDGRAYFWTAEMFEPIAENDPVNHPSHYTDGKIEVCDFIMDKNLNFCLGNAIKYISRCQIKYGGTKRIEDLKKAKWYIERQIKEWENV